jgi:hypothetical protein
MGREVWRGAPHRGQRSAPPVEEATPNSVESAGHAGHAGQAPFGIPQQAAVVSR